MLECISLISKLILLFFEPFLSYSLIVIVNLLETNEHKSNFVLFMLSKFIQRTSQRRTFHLPDIIKCLWQKRQIIMFVLYIQNRVYSSLRVCVVCLSNTSLSMTH